MLSRIKSALFLIATVLPLIVPTPANAKLEVTAGEIIQPLDGVNVTAGYGMLKNSGQKPILVEFVGVEKFKAGEFHETIATDGKSEMRHLKSLKIDAGKSVSFKPGGSHMMLYDPTEAMPVGQIVTVTLKVDGVKTTIPFKIVARQK